MHWSAIQEHKGTQRYECGGERTSGWMSYRGFPKEMFQVKIGGDVLRDRSRPFQTLGPEKEKEQ